MLSRAARSGTRPRYQNTSDTPATAAPLRADGPASAVLVVQVKGAICVATSGYIARTLDRARQSGARLVVIRLDTPGGLVRSMREIESAMLASLVPVAVFVAPPGARAASAGTYIHYSAHVAAMAPSTNLGAATPVPLGGIPSPRPTGENDEEGEKESGSPQPAGDAKAVEDAVAYIRGLAERGKTLLFFYAAGLLSERGIDLGRMRDLLGIDVEMTDSMALVV